MSDREFDVGDYVTRDGTDVQLVKATNGYTGTFVCVVSPKSKWCEIGDEEDNLCRRYQKLPIKAGPHDEKMRPVVTYNAKVRHDESKP